MHKSSFYNEKIKKITQFKINQMDKKAPLEREDYENYII